MKYNIAPGEILLKVSQFDLARGNGRIPIFVGEIMAGEADTKFIAVPRLVGPCHEKFQGRGETADLALQDCLSKIRGVSDSEIFQTDL